MVNDNFPMNEVLNAYKIKYANDQAANPNIGEIIGRGLGTGLTKGGEYGIAKKQKLEEMEMENKRDIRKIMLENYIPSKKDGSNLTAEEFQNIALSLIDPQAQVKKSGENGIELEGHDDIVWMPKQALTMENKFADVVPTPEDLDFWKKSLPGYTLEVGKTTKIPKSTYELLLKNIQTDKNLSKKTAGELTPKELNYWAEYVARTGGLPANLGFSMPQLRTQLLAKGADIGIATGKNAAEQQQQFKAETSAKTSSVSSGARIEEQKVNTATHLINAISQNYDPKTDTYSVPPSMHVELALGIARLMSPSGQVGVQLEEEIRQKTAREGLANMAIYFGFDPKETGGTTQSVANYFAHTIARQGQTAEGIRNQYTAGIGTNFSETLKNSTLYKKLHHEQNINQPNLSQGTKLTPEQRNALIQQLQGQQ